MTVTLLYVDGCVGFEVTRQRLTVAAGQVGLDMRTVVYQAIHSLDEARQTGFRGSPTVLIDGSDPFPGGATGGGLTCRLYDGAAGPEQAPSVEQLVAALRR